MYGVNNSSDAISRDMNSILYSSTFKHPADTEFAKIKQLISLDNNNNSYENPSTHPQHQENSENPPLVSYRSTPSSFFSNLLNENENDAFQDHEPEEIYFMDQQQHKKKSDQSEAYNNMKREKQEMGSKNIEVLGYGYSKQSDLDCGSSFRSDLVRQSSSPAGFLSSLTGENAFAKDLRNGSSSSSFNSHISFSLGSSSSSSRFLPQIAENENELNDSTFHSLKRSRDGSLKMSQNGETVNHTPNLVHHVSLPKTSSEMAAVDNFLHFQQDSSVPWKTRAKRGFATHPRSIAERVRRTRISERIKRLQELFPDMDKQTNTADMLDMAVEYIKDLQNELQTLNDARARCKCSKEQLQSGSTM
ncbi:myc-type, basic helix-loop-helix (bHLH) domain-containing protein [Artemisia annua]|uniref:Myc-type, basic helix-loop-helix (BHLH) domain-containing protein n=1 Tax=Artemisia annua TaxID=35608 RepID=A0A2U1N993_ARTAN|nr:myc-type, basic helix-loop-helix (bHLH) domain-containing protein [Artemisia annua]